MAKQPKKFKQGDIVYHRHLKQYGKFIEYNRISDEEAYVEFTDQYGYSDVKCVTVAQLQGVCESRRHDGYCLKGVSASGWCQFPNCNQYEG